jgi:D-alanyl-lipoteichoic acid acyltransferase DltB (MBOAT superfamily)
MVFSSFTYLLLFFPLAAILVAGARRASGPRAAQASLLVASLVFYGWSKPSNLPLLLGSILVNWGLARWMGVTHDQIKRRWILTVGLVLDISFLCLFKYVNFFLGGLVALGAPRFTAPDWAFPLGISFFTLQQTMYLVDCYEGLAPPSSLVDHATFVAFFPHVISGPLSRSTSFLRQLHEPGLEGEPRWDQVVRGVYLLSLGLAKKVLLADSFARVADLGYAAANECSTLEAWAFSLAYSLQIYFDFSGYSDMAIGSALILGIEIPRNFNAPYRATSVIEFWQRWHISLSGFITTYLYTPILRSFRRATLATASIATLLSMTIAGLWHGPSWGFIGFGTLHGAALVLNQYWKKKKLRKLPRGLAWALTFGFVNLAFIFFRAPDPTTAARLVARLVPGHGALGTRILGTVHTLGVATLLPPLLVGAVVAFAGTSSDDLAREHRPSLVTSLCTVMMVLTSLLYLNSTIVKQFVYFNF